MLKEVNSMQSAQKRKKLLSSSVIICTRNRCADLVHALHSLSKQKELPHELIIVDSSTQPVKNEKPFTEVFNAFHFGAANLVYLHTAPGLPYQRNVGVAHATSDIIHFLDDDVDLDTNYLQSMNETFQKNLHYAGGMGAVQNVPCSYKYKGYCVLAKIFMLQRNFASGTFTPSGLPTHAYGKTSLAKVEALGGCCMSYRASVFQKHQFDERLAGYACMEDCDFSRRVSFEAPLFFNPVAQLLHLVSPISRDSILKNRAMYIRNYRYLFFKNIYPRNRCAILFFAWSVIGLFIVAVIKRDWLGIKGYWQGLSNSVP